MLLVSRILAEQASFHRACEKDSNSQLPAETHNPVAAIAAWELALC